MVEVFKNVVHSLVSPPEDHDNTTTFEVMDVSDMRRRTKPSAISTGLELVSTTECSPVTRVAEEDIEAIRNMPLYRLFENLFTKRDSPLYNNGLTPSAVGASSAYLQALFADYFGYEFDSLLSVSPLTVIDIIRNNLDVYPTRLMASHNKTALEEFYQKLGENNRNELESSGFVLSHLHNMYEWICLLPFDIIAAYLEQGGADVEEIKGYSSEWIKEQDKVLSAKKDDAFDQVSRKSDLANFIYGSSAGRLMSKEAGSELCDLIINYGILDISHFASFPSAMIYDTAGWVLLDQLRDDGISLKGSGVTSKKVIKMLGSPKPCVLLADKVILNDKLYTKRSSKLNNLGLTFKSYYLGTERKITETMNTKQPIYTIAARSEFYEHISDLKIIACSNNLEFNSSTVFDKLVAHGSNPNHHRVSREATDTPSFTAGTDSFSRMSLSRPLHRKEPLSTRLFRVILLGSHAPTDKELDLRDTFLNGEQNEDWFKHILPPLDAYPPKYRCGYGGDFSPSSFNQMIAYRLKKFTDSGLDELVGGMDMDLPRVKRNSLLILDTIRKSIEEMGDQYEDAREWFGNILDRIRNISEVAGIDPIIVQREIDEFANLLERLDSLTFSTTRQFRFLHDDMMGGEGVSFDMQGSTDSYRSKAQDFLAIVNSSDKNLTTSVVDRSILRYFTDYIGTRGDGKTYFQKITRGPIASITILVDRSAPVETGLQFEAVINDIEKNGLTTIQKSLIHPYSYLRNLLWSSTFRGLWVHDPTLEYDENFRISEAVIRNVFSKPEIIEDAETAIFQSGDMTGIPLPDNDTKWRDDLAWLNSHQGTSAETKNKRQKGRIQIPEMIVLNYCWEKAREDCDDLEKPTRSDFSDNFSKNLETMGKTIQGFGDVDEYKDYENNFWEMKFKKLNVRDVQCMGGYTPPTTVEENDDDDDDWGPTTTTEIESNLSSHWLAALMKWIKYIDTLGTGITTDSDNTNSSESNIEPNESSTEEVPEEDGLPDIQSILDEVESSDVPDMVDLDE